jgi:deazaflavin-dependent oxidoreductase (nitroreductase family)
VSEAPPTSPLAGLRERGWYRAASALPLLAWRLGLGALIGRQFMVLTVRGRRSGLERRVMVTYLRVDGVDHAAAIYGQRSQWLRNLAADPRCGVQAGRDRYAAVARRITDGDEVVAWRRRLGLGGRLLFGAYLRMLGVAGDDAALRRHAERLALVAFAPAAGPAPTPIRADLAWVWLPVLLVLAGWRARRRR